MTSFHIADKPAAHRSNRGHGLSEVHALEAPSREDAIRTAAYYRAEARGFESGHDLEDWVEAERQVAETDTVNH